MEQLIKNLIKNKVRTERALDLQNRFFLREHKVRMDIPSKKELLKVYHRLLKQNKIKEDKDIERLLVKRAIRTQSGVTIITVLTKPFACPGKCIYCPDEKRMPKSYISDEPAAARALLLGFDPFEQVRRRILTLKENGHPTDKIELIVKGGSWNAYPIDYQYWFIIRCFQACNNPKYIKDNNEGKSLKKLKEILIKLQNKNESAVHRIIGLTLETRPDMINKRNINIMRNFGCTRIEMGVQTTDNMILKDIKRGHTKEDVFKATKLLKQHGFKVDYHLMPQLPGSTPAKDLKMMREIFKDSRFRPDMIKIYPCTVIKDTILYKRLRAGKYKPYSDRKLIDILKTIKSELPYYVRISRLIRDIPSHHVKAGNKMTNLRQVIQSEMIAENLECSCLRCREIGHTKLKEVGEPQLFIDKYISSDGDEYFLSFEDKQRKTVFAFCRLRIDKSGIYPSFIRELHTYGQHIQIGKTQKKATQHKGMGKELIHEAEKICKKEKIKSLAVISGVGVRGYYKKMGYTLEDGYMVKKILS